MAELPVWQPAGDVPAPEPRGDGSGRVLAIVATEQAASEGWAPAAAASLAHRWAAEGHRVALVDAGLDHPSLHDALGVANREGLTDAALHGASMERVAHPIAAGRFLFISAGTPVADGASVVKSPRWYRITDGMLDAGVTLLVYLRHGDGASTAFLGSASDVVILSGPDGDLDGLSPDIVPIVRAVTGDSDAGAVLSALAAAAEDAAESAGGTNGAPEGAVPGDDPSTFAADASDMGGFGAGGGDMPAWAAPPLPSDSDPTPVQEVVDDDAGALEFEDPDMADVASTAAAGLSDPAPIVGEDPDADASGATEVDGMGARVAPDKGSGGGVTTLLFVLLVIAVATALGWMLSSGAG